MVEPPSTLDKMLIQAKSAYDTMATGDPVSGPTAESMALANDELRQFDPTKTSLRSRSHIMSATSPPAIDEAFTAAYLDDRILLPPLVDCGPDQRQDEEMVATTEIVRV